MGDEVTGVLVLINVVEAVFRGERILQLNACTCNQACISLSVNQLCAHLVLQDAQAKHVSGTHGCVGITFQKIVIEAMQPSGPESYNFKTMMA